MTFAEQPHYIQQIKNIQVMQVDKPRSWKIVGSEEVKSGHDEVVLSFQGVVVQKSLPPVMNRMYVGLLSRHWSTPLFQTCVDKLQDIHSTFKRYVPDGAMEPFELSEFTHLNTCHLQSSLTISHAPCPITTENNVGGVVECIGHGGSDQLHEGRRGQTQNWTVRAQACCFQ